MNDISSIQEEQKILRNELQQLKGCQLTYFTFSVTGTAAILGFVTFHYNIDLLGFYFLAPLVIILPCWLIFFDKATTITRIVGYYRVLERMKANYPKCDVKYIGYERALALYRIEDDGDGRIKMITNRKCQYLRTELFPHNDKKHKHIRHRYWSINWYTFFAISIVCCFISLISLIKYNLFFLLFPLLAFIVVIIASVYTRIILKQVTKGIYSYNENYIFWEYIHEKYTMKGLV